MPACKFHRDSKYRGVTDICFSGNAPDDIISSVVCGIPCSVDSNLHLCLETKRYYNIIEYHNVGISHDIIGTISIRIFYFLQTRVIRIGNRQEMTSSLQHFSSLRSHSYL